LFLKLLSLACLLCLKGHMMVSPSTDPGTVGYSNGTDGWQSISTADYQPGGSGIFLLFPIIADASKSYLFQQPYHDLFSISGSIVNLSGGEIGQDQIVYLKIYQNGKLIDTMSTPLLRNQTFHFDFVRLDPTWVYMASLTYNGIEFNSEPIEGDLYTANMSVSTMIWVFDSTSDSSLIYGEGMHVILDFDHEGVIHVVESMLFFNPSSMVIAPENDEIPLLRFNLDGSATSLQFAEDDNTPFYKPVEGGFGDWQPMLPGSVRQVMFAYDLPFNGNELLTFSLPVHMDSVLVLVEDKNAQVSCSGTQLTINKRGSGKTVELFNGSPKPTETTLSIRCLDQEEIYPVIIGVLVLVVAVITVINIYKKAKKKKLDKVALDAEGKDAAVLDAIIALDDRYKAGEISKESYEAKRNELMTKLEGK
jgi:hypothetical protein